MNIAKDSVFKSKVNRLPENDLKFTPGPGTYKAINSLPHSQIIKEERDSQFYQIIENGARLTKMQPYASNKIDRWNYLNMPEVGFQKRAYEKREEIDEKNLDIKYKKKVERHQIPKQKREKSWETAPSIPSAHNKMLFFSEEDESDKGDGTTAAGSSILNKKSKQSTTEEEKQEISPCSYQPDFKAIRKTTNGPAWGMAKSQRITFENNAKKITTNPQIGPGKYDYNSKDEVGNAGTVDPLKGNSSIFQNQSSIFKSSVERMAYMNPKVKTFVGGKLVKGNTRPKSESNGAQEITVVPEVYPGPWDYYATSHLSTIKSNTKPLHLQFFGSTEERVPFYDRNKQRNDINSDFRGPGTYGYENIIKKIIQSKYAFSLNMILFFMFIIFYLKKTSHIKKIEILLFQNIRKIVQTLFKFIC